MHIFKRTSFFFSLFALAALSLFLTVSAHAQGIYTGGTTGYDVSYPQGGGPYPSVPYNFGIVGVTNGRAYTQNSYLKNEFSWAQMAQAASTTSPATPPSLYMNLNAPIGSTVKGNTSNPQQCKKTDKVCQAYNYGWNAASYSYSYALSSGATSSMWWLDIETGNSWSSTQAINAATIQGAVDFLESANANHATVGIYSTASMWQSIVGTAFTTVLPNWIAGGTLSNYTSLCSQPFIPGASVYLTQYLLNGFDADYACQ